MQEGISPLLCVVLSLSLSLSLQNVASLRLVSARCMGAAPKTCYNERERELRKEGREVPSRVRLREGPIGVRITLGQPTIG